MVQTTEVSCFDNIYRVLSVPLFMVETERHIMKLNNSRKVNQKILLVAALTLVVGSAILPIRASAQIIVIPAKSDLKVQIVIQTAPGVYQQVNIPSGTVVSAPPSPPSIINCPATAGVAIPSTTDCSEIGLASNTTIKLVAPAALMPNAVFYQWRDIPGSSGLPISNSCTSFSSPPNITCTMAGARDILAIYKCKDTFSYDSASKQCKPPHGTGRVTIEKVAQPQNAQGFPFTHSVPGNLPFQLDDDPTNNTLANSKIFTNLSAGSYTFTEATVSGWNLASIVCTPSIGTTTNTTTRAAIITLAAGANVTCKFTNVRTPSQTACVVFMPGRTSCGLDLQIKRAKIGTNNYQVAVSPAAILPSVNTLPNSPSICVNTGSSSVLQTNCAYFYSNSPTTVTLTASSSSGSMPVGFSWSGASSCSGSSPTCTVSVTNANVPVNAVANFPQ